MRKLIGLAILTISMTALPAAAQESALSKILDDPPATGLMVTSLYDGTAAKDAGLKPGDVIVSYGGIRVGTLPELAAAKEAKSGEETAEIRAVRGDRALVFVIPTGQIGIVLTPVKKGVPAAALPPAKGVTYDLATLRKAPRDDWYEFIMPGTGKVGFEHSRLSIDEDELVLRREVAFDGGEQWGINHFDVTVRMALTPELHVVSTRFENPITKWVGEGILDSETGQWVFAWGGEGHERGTRSMPIRPENLPDYIIESLASLLPAKVGTCLHYRSMATGWPGPALWSALHAAAEEEIEIGGRKIPTVRFEITTRGGPGGNRHWVDADGRVVQSHFGGPIARITTREKALAGLHEKIVPRTAGPAAPETAVDPIAAVLAAPSATGMVAMRIIPDSRAERAGLRAGDLLVAYNGESIPDLSSISAAKERAVEREAVVLSIERGGEPLDLTIAPGRLGVYLLPVKEGVPVPPLPAANVTRLDTASLGSDAREEWFALYWEETEKLGYLNSRSRLAGGKLFIRTEVAFDYGTDEGYNHTVVTAVLRVEKSGALTPIMIGQEERPIGLPPVRARGTLVGRDDRHLTWSHRGPTHESTGVIPLGSIPTTAVPILAELMPRKVGACLHFHPLYESVGEAALPCALVCTGAEEVTLSGRSIVIFRYEWRQLGGGVQAVYRVATDGRIVGADHGNGVMAVTSPRDEAISGVREGLLPR